MDPLTALGLAASVVQFVDYGTKLISKTHEIYKSVDGRLVEHVHIRAAATSLAEQCKALRAHARPEAIKKDPLPGEEGLADIQTRCVQLADELLRVVDELRVNSVGKTFKSFRKALKSLMSKERIEKMVADLQSIRAELMMSLLVVMREEQSLDMQKLIAANKMSESTILSNIRRIAAAHEKQVDRLHDTLKSGWLFRKNKRAQVSAASAWLSDHQTIVSDFTEQVQHETAASIDHQIRIKIRDNLCFSEIFQRFAEIPDAELHTFEWAYEKGPPGGSQWSSFGQWLQDTDDDSPGLYWVSGKPGSGKSTLLRYLCKNIRTLNSLRAWAGSSNILLASCFFWNPGTKLQKSQQGLLRTLLFQLLMERPDFPPFLFPKRWQLLSLGADVQYAWSDEELEEAIVEFVDHYGQQSKIILFVDGLDEYEGSDEQREHICNILHKLATNRAMKICASSRPWNIYIDAFHQDPKLRLENLTGGDIREYVDQTFNKNLHFQKWSRSEPGQSEELRTNIVSKAQGVFLWVRLVTNNLLKSLRANDDAYDLNRRLADLPTELEDYFQRMVDGLDKFYLQDTAHMFEFALTGAHDLMTYYFTHKMSVEQYLHNEAKSLSFEDMRQLQDSEDRRINARCMGLLESSEPELSEWDPVLRVVDFLHRTAKDYITSNAVQQTIKTWPTKPFNETVVRLESYICQLKTCDLGGSSSRAWMSKKRYFDLLNSCMSHIGQLYHQDQKMAQILIQKIESAFNHFRSFSPGDQDVVSIRPGFSKDFLAWSMCCGLEMYVLDRLKDLDPFHIDHPTLENRPYLYFAARMSLNGVGLTMSHFRIVRKLLRLGADPNFVCDGNTMWGEHMETLAFWRRNNVDKLKNSSPQFAIMQEFIKYGAVDTVRVGVGKHYAGTRYSKFIRTVSPWDTINFVFEPTAAKELVTLLNKSANAKFSAKVNRVIARLD